ncbi:MAG: hypothetical protein LBI44_06630, partial [Oscillospiraceae bacterium]|nr:hypothetical protein [Oscillospiraceae bacterium]
MKDKDVQRIEHMLQYCKKIEKTIERFGKLPLRTYPLCVVFVKTSSNNIKKNQLSHIKKTHPAETIAGKAPLTTAERRRAPAPRPSVNLAVSRQYVMMTRVDEQNNPVAFARPQNPDVH